MKNSIEPLGDTLDGIMELSPRRHYFNECADPDPQCDDLIGQELAEVFPEVVTVHDDNEEDGGLAQLHAVSYTGLIPVLIRGMQEQQSIIEGLEAQIKGSTGPTPSTKEAEVETFRAETDAEIGPLRRQNAAITARLERMEAMMAELFEGPESRVGGGDHGTGSGQREAE